MLRPGLLDVKALATMMPPIARGGYAAVWLQAIMTL
jgi:hypothetical protein